MGHKIILYISGRSNRSNSVLAALKETGCEVVSTNSPTIAVALLYVMHRVDAIVLNNSSREQASFDVAKSLRQIRSNVPIVLQCGDEVDSSPSRTGRCVSTDELASAVQDLLIVEPVV
jgi:hypothetical protein